MPPNITQISVSTTDDLNFFVLRYLRISLNFLEMRCNFLEMRCNFLEMRCSILDIFLINRNIFRQLQFINTYIEEDRNRMVHFVRTN
jgi:hypothetical protein